MSLAMESNWVFCPKQEGMGDSGGSGMEMYICLSMKGILLEVYAFFQSKGGGFTNFMLMSQKVKINTSGSLCLTVYAKYFHCISSTSSPTHLPKFLLLILKCQHW